MGSKMRLSDLSGRTDEEISDRVDQFTAPERLAEMTIIAEQLADALVDAIAVVPNHWEMKPKGLAAEHLARKIIAARVVEMQRLGGLIKPKQPPQSWYDEDFSGLQGGKSDE